MDLSPSALGLKTSCGPDGMYGQMAKAWYSYRSHYESWERRRPKFDAVVAQIDGVDAGEMQAWNTNSVMTSTTRSLQL